MLEEKLRTILNQGGEDAVAAAEAIAFITDSDDVMVVVEAAHTCVSQRGIKDTNSSTSTACCKGVFGDHDSVLRREVIASI